MSSNASPNPATTSFAFRTAVLGAAMAGVLLAAPRQARATLGGDGASVDANSHALAAARVVQKIATGEQHKLALPSGTVVREYLSSGGAVYAVTWRGPRVPDLRELLGTYFTQMTRRAMRGGRHVASFSGNDLEVRAAGHGHSFAGRAWVPSLVPSGVVVDESLE
jgi:hypothetical protein